MTRSTRASGGGVLQILGQHHLILARPSPSGEKASLPVGWTERILLVRTGSGAVTPYWPLHEYLLANAHRSDAWQAKVARALGLYWDFCLSASGSTTPASVSKAEQVLREFGNALLHGTVRDFADPKGLYWVGQPVDVVRRLLGALSEFLTWYAR